MNIIYQEVFNYSLTVEFFPRLGLGWSIGTPLGIETSAEIIIVNLS